VVIGIGALATGLACSAGSAPPRARHGIDQAAPLPAAPAGGPAGAARAARAGLAGLYWTDFHGIELPVSPSAGPHHIRDGLAWGFTDTPMGALLAAVNIGVRANAQWGPHIFGPAIRSQVTGPGTAALLAACQASYDQASRAQGITSGQPLGPADVTEAAFRWVTYSPVGVTIDIVSVGPAGQGRTARAVTRIEAVWLGGDWRLIAPPGGDWGNSAAPLTSLAGYTRFPVPTS
jgi:hypothetical protein